MKPFLTLFALLALLAGGLAMPAQAQSGERCFAETGYCISGRIREYWEQNGGLPVFGFPIGPQKEEYLEGRPFQVQWFERNRLELHPENPRPYDVLIGRVGHDRLVQQGRDWRGFVQVANTGSGAAVPRDDCRYFEETGHRICGAFLEYFNSHGLSFPGQPGITFEESLALFGLPLSDERTERLLDGREYTVQWFERARFEYHPENPEPYKVLLGLMGNQLLNPPPQNCDVPVATSLRWPYEQAPFYAAMGCPSPWATNQPAAMQYFEHGLMIWVDKLRGISNETIFVIHNSAEGTQYSQHYDSWRPGEPEDGDLDPPPGMYEPQRGFGKVWRENEDVRAALGWATTAEISTSADFQFFGNGAIVWPRALPAQPGYLTRATYVFGPNSDDVMRISQ